MKRLTEEQVKELQQEGEFNVQTLFGVLPEDLADFLDDFNLDDVLKILPIKYTKNILKYEFGVYSDGRLEII